MRVKDNIVCSEMRDVFNYWHMGRIFSSTPQLNSTFVECIPTKRVFAAQDVPGLLVSFGNLIKAFRPLPFSAEPGFIDHH